MNSATLIVVAAFLVSVAVSENPPKTYFSEYRKFAFHLYKTVLNADGSKESWAIAPFVVQPALTLSYPRTSSDVLVTSAFDLSDAGKSGVFYYSKWLQKYYNNSEIKLASIISIDRTAGPSNRFIELAGNNFDAMVLDSSVLDRRTSSDLVSIWTAKKTDDVIQNVATPAFFDEHGSAVVLSLFLKGNLSKPFIETEKDVFWTFTGNETIDIMSTTTMLPFANFDEFTAVRMHYRLLDMSLLIILPKERYSLTHLEENIQSLDFSEVINRLRQRRVYIKLPKFTVNSIRDLRPHLEQIHMPTILSPSDGFDKWYVRRPTLGKVLQKIIFNVNEGGSYREARLAYSIRFGIPLPDPVHFIADHPFLYVLVDSDNNPVLIGRFIG